MKQKEDDYNSDDEMKAYKGLIAGTSSEESDPDSEDYD
jgi:hypothetical protein